MYGNHGNHGYLVQTQLSINLLSTQSAFEKRIENQIAFCFHNKLLDTLIPFPCHCVIPNSFGI